MKLFQRTKEDFVCENCGFKVTGTGYTNHCPKCLYSKHVDVNPGDRGEICQGLMKPIGAELNHGEYTILYKCTKCGKIGKNKSAPEDDFDQIVLITK